MKTEIQRFLVNEKFQKEELLNNAVMKMCFIRLADDVLDSVDYNVGGYEAEIDRYAIVCDLFVTFKDIMTNFNNMLKQYQSALNEQIRYGTKVTLMTNYHDAE